MRLALFHTNLMMCFEAQAFPRSLIDMLHDKVDTRVLTKQFLVVGG